MYKSEAKKCICITATGKKCNKYVTKDPNKNQLCCHLHQDEKSTLRQSNGRERKKKRKRSSYDISEKKRRKTEIEKVYYPPTKITIQYNYQKRKSEADRLIQDLLISLNNNILKELDISSSLIFDNINIMNALSNNNSIENIHFHQVIIPSSAIYYIANFLHNTTKLKYLEFSNMTFTDDKDIPTFFDSITSNENIPLETISLDGLNIGTDIHITFLGKYGNYSITNCIANILQKNKLLNLVIDQYEFDKTNNINILINAISKNRSLKYFRLYKVGIKDKATQNLSRHISKIITENKTITFLDITENTQYKTRYIDDDNIELIFLALTKNHTIENINIALNRIGDIGAEYFAKYIPYYHTLKFINLSLNHITNIGGEAIARALLYNLSIKNINISSNNISEKVMKKIEENINTKNKIPYITWRPMSELLYKEESYGYKY